MSILEHRELSKKARENYRNAIKRNSTQSLATAEKYIIELAKHGYLTVKGKRYDTKTNDIVIDNTGLLIDRVDNPTLEPIV